MEQDLADFVDDSVARLDVIFDNDGGTIVAIVSPLLESRDAILALSAAVESVRHCDEVVRSTALQVGHVHFFVRDDVEQKQPFQLIFAKIVDGEVVKATVSGRKDRPSSTR